MIAASAFLIASTSITAAGPYADFERSLATVYAPYRAALMQSNQKDKTGTEASLQAFEAGWNRLMTTHRSAPPPQYADDAGWPSTIAAIEATIASAKAEAAKGDLAKAHDVLEGVRERLGELRARNGVITFSDRLDAYHERMEHILTTKYAEPDGIGRLREDAAVLLHLTGLVGRHAPSTAKSDEAFKESLVGLMQSTNALQDAARSADKTAIEKALKGLKPAYAKLFVKFG